MSDTRQAGESRIRGGAPRPALGRLGKARGEGASRGRGQSHSPHPGQGPLLPVRLSTGRTVLSAPQPRRAPRAGLGPRKRRQGSAAMSATHPTRLETRTKESNARASQRVQAKPRGAMKVRAGARRLRWDPGPAGSGAPPARLARTVGEVERERVR